MAWASLVLGIVTLLMNLLALEGWQASELAGPFWRMSFYPAVLGLVLGIIALLRSREKRAKIVATVGTLLGLSLLPTILIVSYLEQHRGFTIP